MNKKTNIRHGIYLTYMAALALMLSTGCKKFIQANIPVNLFPTAVVFENDSSAIKATRGIGAKIMERPQSILNGGLSIYASFSADDLIRKPNKDEDEQFISNSLLSGNSILLTNFWKPAYMTIYQANACLEGLTNSKTLSVQLKKELTGEARFMRALAYWYLMHLFGDVPLSISTDVNTNRLLPRTPVSVIYETIIADLQIAWSSLPDTINTLPNKMAAAALLARAHCFRHNWGTTESMASLVLQSNKYRLSTNIDKVFSSTSPETIFQLEPLLSNGSAEGHSFVPPSTIVQPTYVVTPQLLDAFEQGDLRKVNWLKSNSGGNENCFPYKYRINAVSTPPSTEFNIVVRLAELYLIRAEARAYLNNIKGAVADINEIRGRAGLPLLADTITLQQCLDAIRQERRIEFFAEWGHRWLDLKRTTAIHHTLGPVKGANWSDTDQLYPIPLSEISLNANLWQNPGY